MNNDIKEKLIDEIKKGADNAIRDINNDISVSNPPIPHEAKEILINEIKQGAAQAIKNISDSGNAK